MSRAPQAEDRDIIDAALERAKATREVEDEQAIDFLGRVLKLDFDSPEDQALALEFATRLQQTSGPVMAKAVEDTAFYRYNRLIALNEVGGDPDRFGAPVDDVPRRDEAPLAPAGGRPEHDLDARHQARRGRPRAPLCAERDAGDCGHPRCAAGPASMRDIAAMSTARPRPSRKSSGCSIRPLPASCLSTSRSDDTEACSALCERMVGFMLKAVREAKAHTSWTGQNPAYEEAIESFTRAALDPTRSEDFLQDFVVNLRAGLSGRRPQQPVADRDQIGRAGRARHLSRRRALGPQPCRSGQPPSGRFRPARLASRERAAPCNLDSADCRVAKRRHQDGPWFRPDWRFATRAEALFAEGDYVPLDVSGSAADHLVAFARVLGDDCRRCHRPALSFSNFCAARRPGAGIEPLGRYQLWICLRSLQGAQFRNLFTEETFTAHAEPAGEGGSGAFPRRHFGEALAGNGERGSALPEQSIGLRRSRFPRLPTLQTFIDPPPGLGHCGALGLGDGVKFAPRRGRKIGTFSFEPYGPTEIMALELDLVSTIAGFAF